MLKNTKILARSAENSPHIFWYHPRELGFCLCSTAEYWNEWNKWKTTQKYEAG